MTLWHIVRMETPPSGIAGLECLTGQYPVQITLRDLDTGETAVTQACFNSSPDIAHQCANLLTLSATYTPNDWDDECA